MGFIWHLNYNIYKEYYAKYYHDNIDRSKWKSNRHNGKLYDTGTLKHMFGVEEFAKPLINDLNLEGLNILPRFRHSVIGYGQDTHIDIDNVIGVNFNIYDEPIYLVMDGKKYYYESAILDVGKYAHSIPPVNHERLIFKLTIRAPIMEVLERIDAAGYLKTKI